MASRAPDKEREREKEKERKQTCVGCKKKFTKSDYCVICGMCNYWYHKTCAGLSDEIYKCIESYCKDNPHTFWNCMPCSAYAKGITARMRELEGRLEAVEKHQEDQDQEIRAANKMAKDTNKEVKKLEKKIEEAKSGTCVLQELRERKSRRLNVIFYGIGEAEGENPSIEDRKSWDRLSCQNVFNALKLNLKAANLKFLRRVGEKGDRPRPLLVGMENVEDKEKLLANAKHLRDTNLSSVGISADLTPTELQEERDMATEAENRNKNLSEEELSKNMKWLVVGQKGDKRLIKGVERTHPPGQRPQQPSTQPRKSTLSQQHLQRPRTNSKRGHSSSEDDLPTTTKGKKRKPKSTVDTEMSGGEEEASQVETDQEEVPPGTQA